MVKITKDNFLDYIEEICEKIAKSTKKDEDHIIWTGRLKNQRPVPINISGQIGSVNYWQYIIHNKKWIDLNEVKFHHCCDNKLCVRSEHWCSDDRDDLYKFAAYRLNKNSKQEGDCRLYCGYLQKGYGISSFKGVVYLAHVLSLMCHIRGPIPEGKICRHKCKNRNCIAIEHIELGTQLDNAADRVRDGTQKFGIQCPNAVLTEENVLEIYNSKDIGTLTERGEYFSQKFGLKLDPTRIQRIDNGTIWSTVTKHEKKKKNRIKKSASDITQQLIDEKHLEMQKRIKDNVEHKNINGLNHWIWQQYKNSEGYGQSTFNDITISAHRLSYIVFNKKMIPDGLVVRHMCNLPSCVNPEHLEVGTPLQNSADKKKFNTELLGEKNPRSTIDTPTAKMIYISKILGLMRKTRAALFKVSVDLVIAIDTKRSWKHITNNIDKDQCINDLRNYIKERQEWIDATKEIDLESIFSSSPDL
ncbi:MAG: HNH endonuclease [Hyperionvirus sp.]|uniref:HNH endonuclease n=1 Tax=Hyperionvirus sp. TaxID=2487770 RepID=A0A3G5A7T0_9VIRU|nr:MAG: HNH endonuclease [Hyperionvirus sp.]